MSRNRARRSWPDGYVRSVLKKLIEQVPIGAMNLNAIEPRFLGAFSSMPELCDDTGVLVFCERARGFERDRIALQIHMITRPRDGRGCDRHGSAGLHGRMRDSAGMP